MDKDLVVKAATKHRKDLAKEAELEEQFNNRMLKRYLEGQMSFDKLPFQIKTQIYQEIEIQKAAEQQKEAESRIKWLF